MQIKGIINFPLKIGRSKIHGHGVFSQKSIPARKKIGSLAGLVISKKQGRIRAKNNESVSLVELWNGKTLDASVQSNELRFVNHSCSPNVFMRNIGFHVEFYAIRPIDPEEELTCNYGPTHHDGRRRCNCGMPACKGSI